MRIFQLTKKDYDLFLDMDPFLMMERLELPGAFALAAVLENEETGEDIPAGLAICADTGSSIRIDWLCVSMDYRKQGIGEQLLVSIFEIAVQLGYASVAAYINKDFGREFICSGEEGYFKDRLFTEVRPLAGEWVTATHALSQNPLISQKGDAAALYTEPLSALAPSERRKAIAFLTGKKYASSLYSVTEHMEYLDEDLSMLIYEDDRLAGGLLVQNVERINAVLQGTDVKYIKQNVFYPVYMCIESSQGVSALLNAVLKAADKKYSSDEEVHVLMYKGNYAPIMERISPDTKIENVLLIASVEEYLKQDDEAELAHLLTLG